MAKNNKPMLTVLVDADKLQLFRDYATAKNISMGKIVNQLLDRLMAGELDIEGIEKPVEKPVDKPLEYKIEQLTKDLAALTTKVEGLGNDTSAPKPKQITLTDLGIADEVDLVEIEEITSLFSEDPGSDLNTVIPLYNHPTGLRFYTSDARNIVTTIETLAILCEMAEYTLGEEIVKMTNEGVIKDTENAWIPDDVGNYANKPIYSFDSWKTLMGTFNPDKWSEFYSLCAVHGLNNVLKIDPQMRHRK